MNSYTDAETLLVSLYHVIYNRYSLSQQRQFGYRETDLYHSTILHVNISAPKSRGEKFWIRIPIHFKYFASLSAKCLFIIIFQSNRHVIFHFLISKIGSLCQKLLLKWYLNKIQKVKTGTLKRQHSNLRSQNVIKLI